MEVVEMAYRDTVGLLEALMIINETVNDPEKMDEALKRVQEAIEKGVTKKPTKPSNA